jgi:hypothetical protein
LRPHQCGGHAALLAVLDAMGLVMDDHLFIHAVLGIAGTTRQPPKNDVSCR